jgi:4-amino-4-deoxy-L-arabinose transferase-like glycosyltransferase
LSKRGFRWGLVAVFVVAFVARMVAVAQYEQQHPMAQSPVIDEAAYDDWALEIARGDWLGEELFFQEPLYPYWLGCVYSVYGESRAAMRSLARTAQVLLGSLTAVLTALLARRLFGEVAGLIAGAALAVYRPAIWMPALLLKPNLFLPLFVLLALALARTRRVDRPVSWLCVGVLAGLGALLRGNVLVLLPCFVLWPAARALIERRPVRAAVPAALSVVVGIAFVLLPVATRNAVVGGRFLLTTSGAGTNFYGGNNLDNPYGVAKEFDWVRGVPAYEADDWRHEAERREGRPLDAAETSSYWLGASLHSMGAHPLEHLGIFWRKLRLTLGGYEVPDNHFIDWDARYVPLLAAPLPGFALVGGLSLAGLLLFLASEQRRGRGAALELACLVLLYLATIVLTVTSARVRLALVPLLLPFGAAFVTGLRAVPARSRKLAGGALVVAALAVLVPVLPASKRGEDFDERDFNLAGGWIDEGREPERAEALLRGLAERHQKSARVGRRLAQLEYERARARIAGATSEAELLEIQREVEALLARLLTIMEHSNPRERFRAASLAGAMLQDQGQWGPAADLYGQALEFDPEDRDLRRRLAVVLAEAAVGEASDAARRLGLRAAESLLVELIDEESTSALESLLEQVRGQL